MFRVVLVFRLCVSGLLVFQICVLGWVFVLECGFDVWVAGFGFGGFRHLGCCISGVTVEMVVVVGRFAGGGSYRHGSDL